jgi:hypothetical protein
MENSSYAVHCFEHRYLVGHPRSYIGELWQYSSLVHMRLRAGVIVWQPVPRWCPLSIIIGSDLALVNVIRLADGSCSESYEPNKRLETLCFFLGAAFVRNWFGPTGSAMRFLFSGFLAAYPDADSGTYISTAFHGGHRKGLLRQRSLAWNVVLQLEVLGCLRLPMGGILLLAALLLYCLAYPSSFRLTCCDCCCLSWAEFGH